jgi:hypothetical protein
MALIKRNKEQEAAWKLYCKFFELTPQPYTIENIPTGDMGTLQFQNWDKDWATNFAKKAAIVCIENMILSMEFLIIDNMDNDSMMDRLNFLDKVQTELYKL